MSTYVIGDVQGCFKELLKLTKKIQFNPKKDTLIFAGDLVNRGPQSLEVLDFCMQNRKSIKVVLGNHDLYLLSLIIDKQTKAKTLSPILKSANVAKYFNWLIKKPMLLKVKIEKSNETFWISHAGIPYFWSLSKAQKLSRELSKSLKDNPKFVLKNMWGDKPNKWSNNLQGIKRLRLIINCFTRMRYLDMQGGLNLNTKDTSPKKGLEPWFIKSKQLLKDSKEHIVFGHWAALNGKTKIKNIIGLDTGCVWGGKLTAIRLEDKKIFAVKG
jgi:bis(5'-nucleosyl)-tetraphosphatase (symmetrical)